MRRVGCQWPPATLTRCDDGILRPVLSVREAADFLGVSQSTIRRWHRPGLPLTADGRRVVTAGWVYRRSGRLVRHGEGA